MPTLPWATPRPRPALTANPTVMASKFQLRDRRDVPAFFVAALRIRRQMLNSPGALGVSLIAKPPLKGTFFTLSAWESREHLEAAVVGHPPRRDDEALRPHARRNRCSRSGRLGPTVARRGGRPIADSTRKPPRPSTDRRLTQLHRNGVVM